MREESVLCAACRIAEAQYWDAYFLRMDAETETEQPLTEPEKRILAACGRRDPEKESVFKTAEPHPRHPGKMLKAMLIVALLASLSSAVFASDAAPPAAPRDLSPPAANEIVAISSHELSSAWTKARATNGACGYVREAELTAASPASPDDTRWRRPWGNRKKREINVYAADGVTVVGVYRVG